MRLPRLDPHKLTLLLLLAGATCVVHADGYEVQLTRPLEQGARYRLSATGSRSISMLMTRDEAIVRQEERTLLVEIEAQVEILEVDYAGRPLKQALGIELFVYGEGNELTDSMPTGTVIIAETIGLHTEYHVGERGIPWLAAEALEMVVSTYQADIPDDDYIFGTVKLQGLGGSWGVNRQAFADLMRSNGAHVSTDSLDGTVTLEGIEKFSGTECLRVNANVEIQDFSLIEIPDGFEMESGQARVNVSGLFPSDHQRAKLRDATSVEMEVVLKATAGDLAGTSLHTRTTQLGEKTMIPFGD